MKKSYFEKMMRKQEGRIHLAEAALQIAAEEYPDVDIQEYLELLGAWSHLLKRESGRMPVLRKIELINYLLFKKMRFTGNIDNYYDPKNSFLNDVIDSRKGIPISLSVIYLEMAWKLGLEAAGVGFPGHFLVRIMEKDNPLYVDAFHKGRIMTAGECKDFWEDISEGEVEFQSSFLSSLGKREILSRMLRNLKSIYLEQKSYKKLIRVLDKLIVINPDVPEEVRDRGIIYYQMQAFRLALQDFETFLSIAPDSEDAEVIQQYIQVLREYSSRLN